MLFNASVLLAANQGAIGGRFGGELVRFLVSKGGAGSGSLAAPSGQRLYGFPDTIGIKQFPDVAAQSFGQLLQDGHSGIFQVSL
jgi:hypothetical protein